ncbi:MAG: sigma-70 family RNA polymerase sigma factor [Planctomycetes bacterium]|nr:sigma-70 family RNA polymerase sigma factor [Planctomycetota bacterium]
MVHAIVMAHASPGDADDLTQEVFTRALVNIQNLQRADSAGPWFAGIARNVATDSVRRRKPSVELTDIAAARPARGRVDDARDVLESIQTIPVTYRETLMMRLVEGMTGPEIALRTGMTPGSVRVHLHRGMKQLTEILARRGLLQ